jgi:hypothetical protein
MSDRPAEPGAFPRDLTPLVILWIVAGVALGSWRPGLFQALGTPVTAQVDLPLAAVIRALIVPTPSKIHFGALGQVMRHRHGRRPGPPARGEPQCTSSGAPPATAVGILVKPVRMGGDG